MLDLINRRERQILLHSCIYYELDKNIISDYQFDIWSKELVELMEAYLKEFKEFTGSSGAFLNYRLLYDKAYRMAKKYG